MSYQTASGLWVIGDPTISNSVATNAQSVHQHQQQSARQSHQRQSAKVYDSASGMLSPKGGMLYHWPPKLPKAAWAAAVPAIIVVLAMMAFALVFIVPVAINVFF